MTAQIHENLILDGHETSMASCPPLPEGHPQIVIPGPDERAAGASLEDDILESTACWRGYQGTWEIRDGRFYLIDLRGRRRVRKGGGPLLADWFSGVLRVPHGETIPNGDPWFGDVHEQELRIRIERGIVVGTRVIDHRGTTSDRHVMGWCHPPGVEDPSPGDDEW